jgi:2-hydroxy-3-oxopropionate reductase
MFFLDAPVSGGDVGAIAGTLTIMVGGDYSAYERVLPVLQAIGKKITYIGESGAGQVTKACNQIMVAAQMSAMAEILVFAQKSGVDAARVVEAIREGAAACWALNTKPQRLLVRELSPGFKAYMQLKDLNIVLDTAEHHDIELPLTTITQQLYHLMVMAGEGERDNSAVLLMLEALARVLPS